MTAPAIATSQDSAEPADLDTLVGALRARIDDLDLLVLDQLHERRLLSQRIQAARVASGGVRVELSREREILDVYARAMGSDGIAMATAVLRTCRGPL